MNRVLQFGINDVMPEREEVLRQQGIANGAQVNDKIQTLLSNALNLFAATARPKGVMTQLSRGTFETIYIGEGRNTPDTPLEEIYPQADYLALFALTMGKEVCLGIEELFETDDFALGYMLDSVASLAADKAAEVCEAYFYQHVSERGSGVTDNVVLGYSPGYCGWHVSGQKKLFHFLKPERIGISLSDCYLMAPLKSVSGVLVAGRKEIHIFDCNYPCCRDCTTYSCRGRIEKLLAA